MLHFRRSSNGPVEQRHWLPRWMYMRIPFNERWVALLLLGCTILAAGLWWCGPASMEDVTCGVTITLSILIMMWGTLWVDEQTVKRCYWAMFLLQALICIPSLLLILVMKYYVSDSNVEDFLAIFMIFLKIFMVVMPLSFIPMIHLAILGWLRLLCRLPRA